MKSILPASILERGLIAYARYFPFRKGKVRIIDACWRPAAGREMERIARLKFGGFRMRCDLSEMLQRQLYFFGTYFMEDLALECWQRFASEATIIFDVGANCGIYSLAALHAQPRASVHAFEPTPEIASHLKETASLNRLDRLSVHEMAVLDKSGQAVLKRCRGDKDDNGGMNFVIEASVAEEGECVPAVSLDEFCEEYRIDQIDLLKLDVQGNEFSALNGARKLIEKGALHIIFMELNWFDSSTGEAISFLERAGYRFSPPARRLIWKRAGQWMRSHENVIAKWAADTEAKR